jgi:hypothetical protein
MSSAAYATAAHYLHQALEKHPSFDIWILSFDISVSIHDFYAVKLQQQFHAIALGESHACSADFSQYGKDQHAHPAHGSGLRGGSP